LQLSHAGRKASSAQPWNGGLQIALDQGGWKALAPSAISHKEGELAPEAIDAAGLVRIREAFAASARRADQAGVDAIELHGAHGYLLHQFVSPLSNHRNDAYGGNFEARIKFPMEVFAAVRDAFKGVLGIRLSATDWVEGGWTPEETADMAVRLKQAGADYVHISSAGVSPLQKITLGPGYQVPFAKMVRERCGLPTIAVGLITEPAQANEIIEKGEADLVALARTFLYKPRWAWEAAAALNGQVQASTSYWRCPPREASQIFGQIRFGQR
jgi:2,4-dienoyl-CoA reductase-like NADH-dependent reductase (Old Yellow Enzyme family)